MKFCEHSVIFSETSKTEIFASNNLTYFEIFAQCPRCNRALNEREIKLALQKVYTEKSAELVFQAYINKRDYYAALQALRRVGVTLSFMETEL